MRLLIAIPVYNERKYLNPVLNKVKTFHPDILVIDDGSTDGTQGLLAPRKDIQVITHAANQGYGQSLIDAFNWADSRGYDWVITMDCDEQHEPEMIPEFIKEIKTNRWDLISGSRYLKPNKEDDLPPGDRRSINATITEVLNSLFNLRITDAFCGFKAHRVAPTVALKLDETGYAFPMQLWPRVARANLRLSEIPVRLIYNDPNRYFGGTLDDATYRLKHYLSVLRAELEKFDQPASEPATCSGCCCG
ncbi:MAG TPA: glycosyltransferase family 2 protein [Tepidisphaeraceae bacterium]|nr:glycosyltransferase family 2 protein [Tepidisphaeraceae bacterium]